MKIFLAGGISSFKHKKAIDLAKMSRTSMSKDPLMDNSLDLSDKLMYLEGDGELLFPSSPIDVAFHHLVSEGTEFDKITEDSIIKLIEKEVFEDSVTLIIPAAPFSWYLESSDFVLFSNRGQFWKSLGYVNDEIKKTIKQVFRYEQKLVKITKLVLDKLEVKHSVIDTTGVAKYLDWYTKVPEILRESGRNMTSVIASDIQQTSNDANRNDSGYHESSEESSRIVDALMGDQQQEVQYVDLGNPEESFTHESTQIPDDDSGTDIPNNVEIWDDVEGDGELVLPVKNSSPFSIYSK